jgi:uncharacterized protein YbjT (DUF2867 family)
MTQFLDMALKGRVYIFGDGGSRINPIHGEDLAKVCVDAVGDERWEIPVGGPETLRYIEIANMAFEVLGRRPKITKIPGRLVELSIKPLRLFSKNCYTLIKFFVKAMTNDLVAPRVGTHKLREHYIEILKDRGLM